MPLNACSQHVSNGVAVPHPINVSRAAGAYLCGGQINQYF